MHGCAWIRRSAHNFFWMYAFLLGVRYKAWLAQNSRLKINRKHSWTAGLRLNMQALRPLLVGQLKIFWGWE
jgi:hypothetical protein